LASPFQRIERGRRVAWPRPAHAGAPGRGDRPTPAARGHGIVPRPQLCRASTCGAPATPAPAWRPGPSSAGQRPTAARPSHPAAARPADPVRRPGQAPDRSPSRGPGGARHRHRPHRGAARGAGAAHRRSRATGSPASPQAHRPTRRSGPTIPMPRAGDPVRWRRGVGAGGAYAHAASVPVPRIRPRQRSRRPTNCRARPVRDRISTA